MVELVLEHGADTFTLVNLSGWTPLHIADGVFRQGTYKESPQIAEMLRDAMRERGLPTALAELQARSTGGAGRELALTVWEGVYSAEQAARGGEVYRQRCRKCHRRDLSGDGALQGDGSEVVPSLLGFSFEQRWDGATVADMFLTVSRAMPWDAPGTVSPQQNIDVVSYLLEMNGIPAGAAELPADTERLDRIGIGRIFQLVRSATVEEMSKPYVLVARSKGFPRRTVLWRHVLRNTGLTTVTIAGWEYVRLWGGAVFAIEWVFSWPGIGKLTIDAAHRQDFFVLQAAVIIAGGFVVVSNLLVDLMYRVIDNRVKTS